MIRFLRDMTRRSRAITDGEGREDDEMAVRSSASTSAPVTRKKTGYLWPAGIVAWLFGIPLWVIGAFYTLQGWTIGLNLVASVIHLPARAPVPGGWWVLLFIPMGLLYSYVEVKLYPRSSADDWGRWFLLFVIFAAVILSDLGTTYLSVVTPDADALLLSRWAAQTPLASGAWTIFLTFAPEWLVIGGWKLFGR